MHSYETSQVSEVAEFHHDYLKFFVYVVVTGETVNDVFVLRILECVPLMQVNEIEPLQRLMLRHVELTLLLHFEDRAVNALAQLVQLHIRIVFLFCRTRRRHSPTSIYSAIDTIYLPFICPVTEFCFYFFEGVWYIEVAEEGPDVG